MVVSSAVSLTGVPSSSIATTNATVSATVITAPSGSGTASASVTYASNGDHTGLGSIAATYADWLVSGAAADYQIRATLMSGTAPTSGTMNTWQALSSNRSWALAVGAGNDDFSTFKIEIRLAASPNTVLDTATITLNVVNTP